MQPSPKTRNNKRLFLVFGILLVLILAGLAGGYLVLAKNAAHRASANQPAAVRHQSNSNTPHGLNQTPGAQANGGAKQDGSVPDINHFVQSLLKPGTSLSGGGCISYRSSSSDANIASNGQPQMYGYEGSDAPMLGLSFNYCNGTVLLTIQPGTDYDYLRVDWWRPGRNGWSQYSTTSTGTTITNAYYNTYYEVTVDSCVSHWYGDNCSNWSPRVYISTNA
jgi:hypothetical protein